MEHKYAPIKSPHEDVKHCNLPSSNFCAHPGIILSTTLWRLSQVMWEGMFLIWILFTFRLLKQKIIHTLVYIYKELEYAYQCIIHLKKKKPWPIKYKSNSIAIPKESNKQALWLWVYTTIIQYLYWLHVQYGFFSSQIFLTFKRLVTEPLKIMKTQAVPMMQYSGDDNFILIWIYEDDLPLIC